MRRTASFLLRPQNIFKSTLHLIASAFFLSFLTFPLHAQQINTLFSDNFSGGLSQFSAEGSVSTGSYGVRLRGSSGTDGAITSRPFSTEGFTSITLNYTRSTVGLDSGEAGVTSYSVNGGPFTVLETVTSSSGGVSLNLGANAANQSQLQLRFQVNASSYFERFEISSMEVTGVGEGGGDGYGLTSRRNPRISIPVEGESGEAGDPVLVNAFTNLPPRAGSNKFNEPVFFTGVPGSNKNIVVEQGGQVVIFDNLESVSSSSVFLDISNRVGRDGFYNREQGLLGCAFDPNYQSNGYFYCYYTRSGNGDGVLSRFERSSSNPNLALASSEIPLIIVPQPGSSHNGGMIAFNPFDGYLYLSLGDGGCCDDPHNGSTGTAQDLTSLLGSIIRNAPETDSNGGYQIPTDNPFGQNRCAAGESSNAQPCGEIFHYGFRNPWRFSFNLSNGDTWIGDVGQDAREEVNLSFAGEQGINFGWSCREGFIAGPKPNTSTCNSPAERRDPILDFATGPNEAVIGGYVYRGTAVEQLQGRYIYGRIGAREVHVSDENGSGSLLFSTGSQSVYSFGEDNSGELYAVYAGGSLARFAVEGGSGGDDIPTLLSQTGIYSNVPNLTPATGLVPYDVNAQLFSDNLTKTRLLAVPLNGEITFDATGRWRFPVGTVVIKNFFNLGEPVETRALVRGSDQWRGYVYKWNDEKTDAVLVEASGETITLTGGVLYDLPSRGDCQTCHNTGGGADGPAQIIGLQTRQLNADFLYPATGTVDNQLRAMNHVNFFNEDIGDASNYSVYPDYNDASVSLEARAKSYLNINCGVCHREGGGAPVPLLLEYDIPDAARNMFGVAPTQGSVNGAQLIVDPASKENSVLWQRMRLTVPDNRAMPPIAHRQVDTAGVALIGAWIDSLEPIDNQLDTSASGFYQEGAGLSSTPDQFSITNDGTDSITQLVIDLSGSNNAVFDPDALAYAIIGGDSVGLIGGFAFSNNDQVLTLYFNDFTPGKTLVFGGDVDDSSGYTTGAEFAGATLTVTGQVSVSGVFTPSGSNSNRANVSAN